MYLIPACVFLLMCIACATNIHCLCIYILRLLETIYINANTHSERVSESVRGRVKLSKLQCIVERYNRTHTRAEKRKKKQCQSYTLLKMPSKHNRFINSVLLFVGWLSAGCVCFFSENKGISKKKKTERGREKKNNNNNQTRRNGVRTNEIGGEGKANR